MKIDIVLTAAEVTDDIVKGKSVAVIDVFRATSVITEALSNGASRIVPVTGIAEALSVAESLKKQQSGDSCRSTGDADPKNVLLGGERDAVIIEGFDLGNSPLAYTEEAVEGKTIVFTTTNGTRAVCGSDKAAHVCIASFLNMSAVCDHLYRQGGDCVIVCSGRQDVFTAEDAVCAGAMAGYMASSYGCILSDLALVAHAAYDRHCESMKAFLSHTLHFRYMMGKGLENDIDFCLQKDIYNIVPVYDRVKKEIRL